MAQDVFISYSIKDDKIAGEICSAMEKKKIRCWIAPRDINPGDPFAEAIIDGIKGSSIFILNSPSLPLSHPLRLMPMSMISPEQLKYL
jgi:TIR domain